MFYTIFLDTCHILFSLFFFTKLTIENLLRNSAGAVKKHLATCGKIDDGFYRQELFSSWSFSRIINSTGAFHNKFFLCEHNETNKCNRKKCKKLCEYNKFERADVAIKNNKKN